MSNTSNGPRSNEPLGSASANEPSGEVLSVSLPLSSPPTKPSAMASRGGVYCRVTFAGNELHAPPGQEVKPKPSQVKPANGLWIGSTAFGSVWVIEGSSNWVRGGVSEGLDALNGKRDYYWGDVR